MSSTHVTNKSLVDPLYAFTPYRICPLGAHVDHQKGPITGFAIDKGIHINYQPTEDGLIEVSSVQFDGVAVWSVFDVPESAVGDWSSDVCSSDLQKRKALQLEALR